MMRSPYLTDLYAPVEPIEDETTVNVEGSLPECLKGVLLCNSSNPAYNPRGAYSWFDGDGMVHATYIENGKATYRRRYVETEGLEQEREQGRATYRGIFGTIDYERPLYGLKNSSNTALIYHNKKLLSLWYLSGKPYELDLATLETRGIYNFGGNLPRYMAAHTKTDPVTGELVFFEYDLIRRPYMQYGVANGEKVSFIPIDIPKPSYCHDIAISENYSILIDMPLTWKAEKRRALLFDRDRPTRFGVIPRHGGNDQVRWFEAEPCYMFHVINAYEEENKIILTGCRIDDPMPTTGGDDKAPREGSLVFAPVFYRWVFDLETGQTTEEALDDVYAEFPRINDAYMGRKSRFSYHGRFTPGVILQDALVKYDAKTATSTKHEMPEGHYCNEAIFASDDMRSAEEDGGFVLTYISKRNGPGEVWVYDAQNIETGPLSKLILPDRIPALFHGTFIKA